MALVMWAAVGTRVGAADLAFQHPGILHTRADLERIRRHVAAGAEPWRTAFEQFAANPYSRADYPIEGGFEHVTRDPKTNLHNTELWHDCNAAYQNALMWAITGDAAHAAKSADILRAWAGKLKVIDGHDKHLAAGLYGFKFVNAAEILRYTYPKFTAADAEACRRMFLEAFYPVVKDFATFANGNWDGACMKMIMATGVYCDDRAMFDRAVEYYRNGSGNGRLTHYVINDTGQCQESGRDQAHTQLGLGLLAECCEIAWHQGIDLYGEADNRLLEGYEYTARYNLGHDDVPFAPHTDTTGKYVHRAISPDGRGKLRAVWEIAYNHYHNRRRLEMPYTKRVIERMFPEGPGFQADHPGFGTLLFDESPMPVPSTRAAAR
jgi:hypothetical protein